MKNLKSLFSVTALAATALTTLALTMSSGSAISAKRSCGTKAECACQIALDSGSTRALRAFLRLYPKSNTACGALASTAVAIPDDDNQGNNNNPSIPTSTPGGGGNNGGDNNGDDNEHHDNGDDNEHHDNGGDNEHHDDD
jgi:hypothetical protein